MAVTTEKRRGFRVEVGHNEQVSRFIRHTYLLFEVFLFFYSGTGFGCCLFVSKKEFALGNRGWCPRGLTFEKVLGIPVAQQCLLMAHIRKVYSVFHHSFFSDVGDSAQNKEASKGSVILGPGAALDAHKSGCGELAAGSHRALFFPRHKGRTAVATQRVAWCCGALLGGHRKGCGTKSPFCGLSFCQFLDPRYHQKRSPGSRGGGWLVTLGQLPPSFVPR